MKALLVATWLEVQGSRQVLGEHGCQGVNTCSSRAVVAAPTSATNARKTHKERETKLFLTDKSRDVAVTVLSKDPSFMVKLVGTAAHGEQRRVGRTASVGQVR